MSVLSKEELLNKLNEHFTDDSSDSVLTLMEDICDTINSYEEKNKTDWKSKYEENDKNWREKYKKRFFESDPPDDGLEGEIIETEKKTKFDDLFEIKEV